MRRAAGLLLRLRCQAHSRAMAVTPLRLLLGSHILLNSKV